MVNYGQKCLIRRCVENCWSRPVGQDFSARFRRLLSTVFLSGNSRVCSVVSCVSSKVIGKTFLASRSYCSSCRFVIKTRLAARTADGAKCTNCSETESYSGRFPEHRYRAIQLSQPISQWPSKFRSLLEPHRSGPQGPILSIGEQY